MPIVGLVGSIASGKSEVSRMFQELGATIVPVDLFAHRLTGDGGSGEALPAIREEFGDEHFDGDVLNRRRLGRLVFSDESARLRLNSIMFPLLREQVMEIVEDHRRENPNELLVIECPLLEEMGLRDVVDEVVMVGAPEETRLRRMMGRDGLSREEALDRIGCQDRAGMMSVVADHVIDNDVSKHQLRKLVGEVWMSLMAESEEEMMG